MTSRSLADWLAYLEQLHPKAIDMGLDRLREVASRLGTGKPAPLVVTVTGTNGKGSTCAFIAGLLEAGGKRVGIYASPHLLRYNERVRIAGRYVSDEALCEAFEAVEQARGAVSLTYFEVGTLAAFWLFERAALDAVVLEVGLGGRLDAVNLIDPDVSVITNIGLDHAEWLGDTRDSVAREKAGIFRSGVPAVCGDLDPPRALLEAAADGGVPLDRRGLDYDFHESADSWNWRGTGKDGRVLHLEALPRLTLPTENAALALQAVARLGLELSVDPAAAALLATRIAGRLDRRTARCHDRSLSLLLDVGHNAHAAHYLARHLRQHPLAGRRHAIFGLLADKDLDGILDALAAMIDEWSVVPLDTPRARPVSELAAALKARGAAVREYGSVAAALEAACSQDVIADEWLVFGSFYCVAEGLAWLDGREPR